MASSDFRGWWRWRKHEFQQAYRLKRLRRRFWRLTVGVYEDRLAPDGIMLGSLLAGAAVSDVPDGNALSRSFSSPLHSALAAPGDGAAERVAIAPAALANPARHPTSAPDGGARAQAAPDAPSHDRQTWVDVAHSAFDTNPFAALDQVFASGLMNGPGAGPEAMTGLPALELFAALAGGGIGASASAPADPSGSAALEPMMAMPSELSPHVPLTAQNVATASPPHFTLTPTGHGASQPLPFTLTPTGQTHGAPQTVTPPVSTAAPPTSGTAAHPAPDGNTSTVSPVVLESVQAFGPAGHQRLFVQGHLLNVAPLGTAVTLDFHARQPGQADQLLASRVVTQTVAGRIDFTVNLEANLPPGTMLAAAVHGRSDGPSWTEAAWLPNGHTRPSYMAQSATSYVTVPDGAAGQVLTLSTPGQTLENVQVLHPPGLDQSLPMGLIGFSVTDVPIGGSAIVTMTLPAGMTVSHYYKEDPATGVVSPFDFDGHVGAQIHGNVIILHLVDGGLGDADGTANGVIVDPGGPSTGLLQNTVVVPAATTGELVTLQSPVYPFTNVQTYDPPTSGVNLPLGLFGFTISGVPIGGAVQVTETLPSDVWPSRYIKQDPVTGLLTLFDYDGITGAVINDQTITLNLVDGGRGDADGLANGIIVDPGGPGSSTLTIPVSEGLGQGSGWTVFNTGGSGGSQGAVTYNSGTVSFNITEGNSFNVGLKHLLTIPSNPGILTFDYSGLTFDGSTPGVMNDAFEAAFVDANGNSLVSTIGSGRNVFFNVTAGMNPVSLPEMSVTLAA